MLQHVLGMATVQINAGLLDNGKVWPAVYDRMLAAQAGVECCQSTMMDTCYDTNKLGVPLNIV